MSEGKKLKLQCLAEYLLENADEEHAVTYENIKNHLEKHDISLTRKTLYDDLALLHTAGIVHLNETMYENLYETKTRNTKNESEMLNLYNKRRGGYCVYNRDFSLLELQLLIDSLQSSKFIPLSMANEISEKLQNFASKHNRKLLQRRCYVPNRIRNDAHSVFYGIDNIHLAIAEDKQISFSYFTYNVKKEKKYNKSGENYVVSPYALMWSDDNYYLIAFDSGKIKHFRVDRIDKIKKLDERREGKEEFKKINLSERKAAVFGMYGSEAEIVSLRFSNHLIGVVIDRFGKDTAIMPQGEKHFATRVNVEVSPQFFGWLCGLGRGVKVLSPDRVTEKFAEYVANIAEMYQE